MFSKKQLVFVSVAIFSLLVNGYLAIQWRLCRESRDGAAFVIDIAVAKDRINQGMTYEETVARVHREPDEIQTDVDGNKRCVWSAIYHYGTLEKLFGYAYENGHYYLLVEFDATGKVVKVTFTEG